MSMIKFAKKSNPEAISAIEKMEKTLSKDEKAETTDKKIKAPVNLKKRVDSKDDMELAKIRKDETKKELEPVFAKKAKDDLTEVVNISQMKSDEKLKGYKAGEKVKIYDTDDTSQFVEIFLPENPTAKDLLLLVKDQIDVGAIRTVKKVKM